MSDLKFPTYGGQAVIEGVLMRGSQMATIAMRAPDKSIVLHTEPLGPIYRSKAAKIYFLRGLVMLWDGLSLGMRALTISANTQTGEEEKLEGPVLYLTLAGSLAVAVVLFFLAPAWLGQLTERFFGWNAWWSNLAEGVIRLFILVGYIWSVGRVPDIARVFAYHGAEHKTINAFEAGAELTPEVVAQYSLEHPRCGTAFLLNVVVFSIVLFSLLGPLPMVWRLLSRILLLPVLASVAYEYLRWSANHAKSPLVALLLRPNLALQHLTTREPSLDIIEVAIAAFQTLRQKESDIIA